MLNMLNPTLRPHMLNLLEAFSVKACHLAISIEKQIGQSRDRVDVFPRECGGARAALDH